MVPGFVLVHGYTGSPEDFGPLAGNLGRHFGAEAVQSVLLPGHGRSDAPRFEPERFRQEIATAAEKVLREGRRLVLIGHSTGGSLILSYIMEASLHPALLVLAGVPKRIGEGALERWERHRADKPAICLNDVARMVLFVNRIGAVRVKTRVRLLVLHGEADRLVPPADALKWLSIGSPGTAKSLIVPAADHDLFIGTTGASAADRVSREAKTLFSPPLPEDRPKADRLVEMEGGGLETFLAQTPSALVHLVRSPGALEATGDPFIPAPRAETDPIQLNIEVTTRCNMACRHCARSGARREARDMAPSVFRYLLDLMPHSYRVVLVGLGEPTLHPRLVHLVAGAAEKGRRVSLVTNGSVLDPDLSRKLIAAGLSAIAFSLDSAEAETAARVRPGAPLGSILDNIRGFTSLAAVSGVATAVFTAISVRTVAGLPQLAETVAGLGVQAWMLSDLNFDRNLPETLWQNRSRTTMEPLERAVKAAFARGLPAIGVWGLEALGISRRFREFLPHPPSSLCRRSARRARCLSPWQTLPVDVEGNAAICDCRPGAITGSMLEEPFSDIWNGRALQSWRRRMIGDAPPRACLNCPRF